MSPFRSPGSGPTDGGVVRRLPIVVFLLVVVLAAVAAGDPEPRPPLEAASTKNAVALPPSGARSTAWYCPGAPPTGKERVSTAVSITNAGSRDTAAAVTVIADGGRRTTRRVELPAHTVVPFRPDVAEAAHPAIVVEPFAAEVVVEQNVWDGADLAVGPCATQPAANWYFANGTTLRGIEQWLILFNPFGDDAIVDLSFYTDEGRREVAALRGVDVARHSRVAIPIDAHVRRQAFVATEVSSRVGRVVAQQSQVFLPESGRSGITASLGSPSAALEWWFPFGYRREGENRTIGISNPGDLQTEVDVQVFADGEAFIEPVTVTIPRRSAVLVNLGDCGEGAPSCVNVPRRLAYQTLVSSATDLPVVAEELAQYTGDALTGAMSSLGGRGASSRWVFGRSRYSGEQRSNLVLTNPGSDDIDVVIRLVGDGEVRVPAALDDVTVPAGRRVVIDLTGVEPNRSTDAGVVVEASAPIVGQQAVIRSEGISVHSGVPERD